MPKVIYKGPKGRFAKGTSFTIDGHVIRKDQETNVPAAVAKELSDGSERTKGHKFEKVASQGDTGGNS